MTTPPQAASVADASDAPKRGRPRRLELDQVIEAALAVGLQRLTMAAVAKHLGVAKAVLYGYVGSREELVRLASTHASRHHRFPEDTGQSWSVWILEYARALFEVMTIDGNLFEAWLSGGQSPLVEVDAVETWLQAMTIRGFSGEEALHLRRSVSHLVIGAAASMKRDRALRAAGRSRLISIKKAVLVRPSDQNPLLREFLDKYAADFVEESWEFDLFVLLQGVTAPEQCGHVNGNAQRLPKENTPPS